MCTAWADVIFLQCSNVPDYGIAIDIALACGGPQAIVESVHSILNSLKKKGGMSNLGLQSKFLH